MKVEYIDHMGSDLRIVNTARVSFKKQSDWEYFTTRHTDRFNLIYDLTENRLSKADTSLIHYLARGMSAKEREKIIQEALDADTKETLMSCFDRMNAETHWAPFAHTCVQMHFTAPIFVARQLGKHQVGLVWSEVSRRYVDTPPEFYNPPEFRYRADNVKQGSSQQGTGWGLSMYNAAVKKCIEVYNDLLEGNIAPEQARMVLPQSMMTEWVWTGSMLAFHRVYRLRSDAHAQKETQEIAKQIAAIIEPLFPVSWAALTGRTHDEI